jgi:hypothetical protein
LLVGNSTIRVEIFGMQKCWYASCNTEHDYWACKYRDTREKAKADADAHDKATHGGSATAIILDFDTDPTDDPCDPL